MKCYNHSHIHQLLPWCSEAIHGFHQIFINLFNAFGLLKSQNCTPRNQKIDLVAIRSDQKQRVFGGNWGSGAKVVLQLKRGRLKTPSEWGFHLSSESPLPSLWYLSSSLFIHSPIVLLHRHHPQYVYYPLFILFPRPDSASHFPDAVYIKIPLRISWEIWINF